MMRRFSPYLFALLGFLLLAGNLAKAQVTTIQLNGTTDASAYEGDTVRVPVIINTTGLSDENIIALRLEFESSGVLKPIGIELPNTLISGWTHQVTSLSANAFALTAAGTMPIAQDSGVLVWVRYQLQEVAWDQTASYYLRTQGNNYFNEGGYGIGMTNGEVMVRNRPTLSVWSSSTLLVRGDSTLLSASGGTEPYSFSSTNANVAVITSGNYLKALNPGRVFGQASDVGGLTGQSQQIEVRGYRLSFGWPETEIYPNDTVTFDIRTSNLNGLNVLAGTFDINLSGMRFLSVQTAGTLLNGQQLEVSQPSPNKYKLAFATGNALQGSGTMATVRAVITATGHSSIGASFDDNIMFNEDLRGAFENSSKSVSPRPTPVLSGSIPTPVLAGQTIQFTASSGLEPYTWSVSNPNVASINQEGLFTAKSGGNTRVRLTDLNNVTAESGSIGIYDGTLTIASQVATYASEHLLPVEISALPQGRGFSAFDLQIQIDTSRISFLEVVRTGTLSEPFTLFTNSNDPRQIRVVGAGQAAVTSAGILFYFKIKLKESFTTSSTALTLQNVLFNEGDPKLWTINGVVTPGDPPPVAGNSSISTDEDTPFTFSASDFFYTQSQGKPLTWVQVTALPALGQLRYANNPVALNQQVNVQNLGNLTYLPPADLHGNALSSFEVKVGDPDFFSNNTGTITIDVNPVNDPPRFSLSSALMELNESFENTATVAVTAEFPPLEEDETYVYSLAPSELDFANMTFDPQTGEVTLTAVPHMFGEQQFEITANDGQAVHNTASRTFTFRVLSTNVPPVVEDQTFEIAENSAQGTAIGQIVANDADANDVLTYSITAGNDLGTFAIDTATGWISVADSAQLDYELSSSFVLQVQVADAESSASALLTIHVQDVFENQAPQLADQLFSLPENSITGYLVGEIMASDPDGNSLMFEILSGNENNAFALDATTGAITVATPEVLDFESQPQFVLTISVSDGELSATATITIQLEDVDEAVNQAPQIQAQSFSIPENSPEGAIVGQIVAGDPDNDALEYSVDSELFAIDNTGLLTVADGSMLDYETQSVFEITVTVSDGELSTSAEVTIALEDVNEAPFGENITFSIDENRIAGYIVGQLLATDPEGSEVTFGILSGNETGAFTLSPQGNLTVALAEAIDFEINPTFILTISLTDGELQGTMEVTINLNDIDETVNQAPQLLNQQFSIPENATIGTLVNTILATDPDSENLTFTVEQGDVSAFDLNTATGEITVASALDYETTSQYQWMVTVSDGELSASAEITIIVEDVNEHPVVADQTFSVDENRIAGFVVGSVQASDPEGQTLAFSILDGNVNDAFAISSTGVITVGNAAAVDFETTPVFELTVEVSDGTLSATAIITIQLNDVDDTANQTPQIQAQQFTIAENRPNGTTVGQVQAGDPDGDVVSFAITDGNTSGAFAINSATGILSVANQAALDFETNPSFTLTISVSDGELSAHAQVTILLTNVNEFPVIAAQTFSVDENSPNGTQVGQVMASDVDGDVLAYAIIAGNTAGAFAISSSGELTVANATALDFESQPTFELTVRVSDGAFTASAIITITLNDINEAPLANAQSFTLDENSANGTVVGTVVASDPEANTLTYTLLDGNVGGAFAINVQTGELTVANQNPLDFETTPQFRLYVEVSDGALSTMVYVTIQLNDLNEQPTISEQVFSIAENSTNGTLVGTVVASDPDGNGLTFSIQSGNESNAFAINEVSGELTVSNSGALDFESTPAFTLIVSVSDETLSATASITVNLTNVNEAPVLVDQVFSIPENSANGTLVGTVIASDPDGDQIALSIQGGNDLNVFTIANNGVLSITNNASLDFEVNPSFTLTIQASDGALVSTATVTVNVEDVNEAPTGAAQSFNINENAPNSTVVGTVVASDPEGDALTYGISNGNINGAFTIGVAGEITVANSTILDFETNPTFVLTIAISDGALSGNVEVTIQLNDLNEAPIIVDQTFSLPENSPNGTVAGAVQASDPDGNMLTYSITAGNTSGAFSMNSSNGQITVANQSLMDFETNPVFNVTVQVSDGSLSASANIRIDLTDVEEVGNQAPVIGDQSFEITENSANGTLVGAVIASDPDGDALSYAIAAGNTGDAFAIDEDNGQITVANQSLMDFETNPVFNLTVQVSDGSLTASANIHIDLTDVEEVGNQAPVIGDQSFEIAENSTNGTLVGTVVASDPDGDALSYAITAGNTGDAFAINATNGQITVSNQSLMDFETNPVFNLTVQVSDGSLTSEATVTITLTDVDEEPALSVQPGVQIRVYPNPARDFIEIAIPTADARLHEVLVFDGEGKLIHQESIATETTLDIRHWLPGHYLIRVNTADGSHLVRIIKTKE